MNQQKLAEILDRHERAFYAVVFLLAVLAAVGASVVAVAFPGGSLFVPAIESFRGFSCLGGCILVEGRLLCAP